MRKKLGEKKESMAEQESIDDFEEFTLLDTKKDKSISKDSKMEETKRKEDEA